MMSQVELWSMQDYCREKNEERQKIQKQYGALSLAVLIAGIILMIASVYLISFIFRTGMVMICPGFLAVGVIGLVAGAVVVVLARSVKLEK